MNFNRYFGQALIAGAAIAMAAPAIAQTSDVTIKSVSFVEKVTTDAQGNKKVTLAPPTVVVPGDTVVFTHEYVNTGATPATGFLINNPLSSQIQYINSPDANIVMSVDGGKTFGKLEALKVGDRAAIATDVTNLRWTFTNAIKPGERGKVSFRGLLK